MAEHILIRVAPCRRAVEHGGMTRILGPVFVWYVGGFVGRGVGWFQGRLFFGGYCLRFCVLVLRGGMALP